MVLLIELQDICGKLPAVRSSLQKHEWFAMGLGFQSIQPRGESCGQHFSENAPN